MHGGNGPTLGRSAGGTRAGWMLLVAGLLAILELGIGPAPAVADTAAQSRFHDQRARRFYQQGRYEEAIQEFFLVQRLVPSSLALFNIGLCFRQLGRESEAFLAMSEYLASLPPDDPDDGRRAQAEQLLERLAPEVARVRVESDPPGAEIFVDGVENGSYGHAPRLIAVRPGPHSIILRHPGYRPSTVPVEVAAGDEAEVVATMTPLVGTLAVNALPAGEVRVVDPEGTVVAQGDTPFEADVRPGTYAVEVARPGYRTFRDLARVDEERTTELTPALRRLPRPTGRLTVTSNVDGAAVFVDEAPVGFTPLILPAVDAGAHDLRVEADDRQPFEGGFEVTPETPSWATVTLERDDLDRHSPATWVLGAGGAAALIAAGGVGIAALRTHRAHEDQPTPGRAERGTTLNATADVLWITGTVALAAAVVLYIIEENREERRSRGTVTTGTGETTGTGDGAPE